MVGGLRKKTDRVLSSLGVLRIHRPEVGDDVISVAQSLLQVVQDHMDANLETLPQGPGLPTDVAAALETARTEWLEAEGLKSEYQKLVEENRTNAQRFSDLLVAFR